MFKSIPYFSTVLEAGISAVSSFLIVPTDAVSVMASNGIDGSNYTEVEIYDGINREIVAVTNTSGPTGLQITRAQAGTSANSFPAGSEIKFIWTDNGIAEVAGATASINFMSNIVGAISGGPSLFNVDFPVYTSSDNSITVTGGYPYYDIAVNVSELPAITGVTRVMSSSDFNIVDPFTTPQIYLTNVFPTVVGGNTFGYGMTGNGVISGIRVSNTGRLLDVSTLSLPNGVFTNPTVTVSGGVITSIVSGATPDAPISGGVNTVNTGTGIVITGTPTLNPTISIANTGVTAGLYEGVQVNAQGQIVALPAGFGPVSAITTSTVGVTVASGGTGIKTINIATASDSAQGLVELADNTEAQNPVVDNKVITPKTLAVALNHYGKVAKYSSRSGSMIAGGALTTPVQSCPASEAKYLIINATVNFNDPAAGANMYKQSFSIGIYANGTCIFSTPAYESGIRSVSTTLEDFEGGFIELRATTPTGTQVVSGELSIIGFGEAT